MDNGRYERHLLVKDHESHIRDLESRLERAILNKKNGVDHEDTRYLKRRIELAIPHLEWLKRYEISGEFANPK